MNVLENAPQAGPLEGRMMVITGGGAPNGIGATTARICAERGAQVVIGDINKAQAEETAKQLNEAGLVHVSAVELDVTKQESVARFMKESSERMGGINVVFANAGITIDKGFKGMTPEKWLPVIDVNLNGVFRTIHEALPYVLKESKETGFGRLIATSSIVGNTGNFGQANYAASKAGIQGFMKTLGLELTKDGINSMYVCPGFIETPMTAAMPPEALAAAAALVPAKRLGKPEDIAKVVAFLASDDSAYMSGSEVKVNGGFNI